MAMAYLQLMPLVENYPQKAIQASSEKINMSAFSTGHGILTEMQLFHR